MSSALYFSLKTLGVPLPFVYAPFVTALLNMGTSRCPLLRIHRRLPVPSRLPPRHLRRPQNRILRRIPLLPRLLVHPLQHHGLHLHHQGTGAYKGHKKGGLNGLNGLNRLRVKRRKLRVVGLQKTMVPAFAGKRHRRIPRVSNPQATQATQAAFRVLRFLTLNRLLTK